MVKKDKHYYSHSKKRKEQAGYSAPEGKYFFGMYAYRLSRTEQFLLWLGGFGFLYFIHNDLRFEYTIIKDQIFLINNCLTRELDLGCEFENNQKGIGAYIAITTCNYWTNNH